MMGNGKAWSAISGKLSLGKMKRYLLSTLLRAVSLSNRRDKLVSWIARNIWAVWVGFVIGGSFVWLLFRVVK